MTRLESDHDAYMDTGPEHTRQGLRHYLPMFEDLSPVLELGCGRGEFLGPLADKGHQGRRGRRPGVPQWRRRAQRSARRRRPRALPGVFCAHVVEHLTPDQVGELLAGVRRVLAPGGRFVAVTPNPAGYAVLSHDLWRDPTHVRFYDLPLLESLCRQAGLEVEATVTNPANHPGPPPEYLGPEPVVHSPLDDLIERAMGKLRASLDHHDRRRRVTGHHHHDPQWAYELAHLVKVLAGRLQETTENLREVRRAYDKLAWGLYQSNETYVVARADPGPEILGASAS